MQYVSICLSPADIYLFICLGPVDLCPSVCLRCVDVCLNLVDICLSVHPSASGHPSACPFASGLLYLSICLRLVDVCLSIHLLTSDYDWQLFNLVVLSTRSYKYIRIWELVAKKTRPTQNKN